MKEENETIIKAINMYGRVPEQWELLNEIEKLQEELKYSISIVEHNKTIQSNINSYNKLSKYSSDLEDKINKAIELLKTLDEDTLSNMQLSLEIIGHIEYVLKGSE